MGQLLNPTVLRRVQDSALKMNADDQPLAIAEIFRAVTDGIWGEAAPNGNGNGDKSAGNSIVRRNLQREHIKKLSGIVLGPKGGDSPMMIIFAGDDDGDVPPDARSLARRTCATSASRIQTMLNDQECQRDDRSRIWKSAANGSRKCWMRRCS